ncbi:MAG: Rnase Y domain-containing protein, partial [Dictyoglomus sp.]
MVILGFILGLGLGYFGRRYFENKTTQLAEKRAEEILKKAQEEAEEKKRSALLEAKEEIFKLRNEAEREIRERRNELSNFERRILQREENLERKEEILANKEKEINNKLENLKKLEEEAMLELQRIAQMSKEEAREMLLRRVEEEIQKDIALKIKELESRYKEIADEKAREILIEAIQRCAVDHTVESTVSVVSLPSEEMKGRIIGREGRNIRTFETLTGVDLIIDDTPEAVVLSSFDPIRREIARIALEKLVKDGRIHP